MICFFMCIKSSTEVCLHTTAFSILINDTYDSIQNVS
jgi:hypothetical protein